MVAVLVAGAPADARSRLVRRYDTTNGLHVSVVTGVGQGEDGVLWVGTGAGLVRYDGDIFERVHPEVIRDPVHHIVPRAGGGVWARDAWQVYEVTASQVQVHDIPGGWGVGGALDLDARGRPVVTTPSGPWRLEDGEWRPWRIRGLDAGERVRGVVVSRGEEYLVTSRGALRLGPAGAERLFDLDALVDLQPMPDGSIWAMVWYGPLLHFASGELAEGPFVRSRGHDLLLRGDTLWAGYDHALLALREGEAAEIIDEDDGLAQGGPLFVDAEGSLWVPTPQYLAQLPEPETAAWQPSDGVPVGARFLTEDAGGIWLSTWDGLGRLDRTEEGWSGRRFEDIVMRDRVCVDGQGVTWMIARDRRPDGADGEVVLTRWRGEVVGSSPVAEELSQFSCDTDSTGTVWFGTWAGLRRTSGEGLAAAAQVPDVVEGAWRVRVDSADRLWVAGGDAVCSAPRQAVWSGEAEWRCDVLDGVVDIFDLVEIAPGRLWLATQGLGLVVREEGAWRAVGVPPSFPSPTVRSISLSPRGGAWIGGLGAVERVEIRDGRFEILETLDGWHGLTDRSPSDVVEQADGTLWLAGSSRTFQLPASVRNARIPAPPVVVTRVVVDGRDVPLEGPVELPYRDNRLEIDFSAASYRDPTRLRYRGRLGAGDAWEQVRHPFFRYVDLRPGHYTAEVQASLDGVSWSPVPAALSFSVHRPLYLQWWAIALYIAGLVALLLVAHRVRLARSVALERERLRIALDLHDEMGSGLGSISVLAGLLFSDALPVDKRSTLASQIANNAEDLATSLTDIVWSLRSGSGSPQALVEHLAERGHQLFAGGARFEVQAPAEWPRVTLSVAVRRNLQLIALEALHNAARHARATQVVLALEVGPRRWRLVVRDDGCGIEAGPPPRRGHGTGLDSLRLRAERIGATLDIRSEVGAGTEISVSFAPGAHDRRVH